MRCRRWLKRGMDLEIALRVRRYRCVASKLRGSEMRCRRVNARDVELWRHAAGVGTCRMERWSDGDTYGHGGLELQSIVVDVPQGLRFASPLAKQADRK